jgi:hypothetical protein
MASIFMVEEKAEQDTSMKTGGTLVSCSAYSSTLKMEAICSSETSVVFQRSTRLYIPEDSTLQTKICSANIFLLRIIPTLCVTQNRILFDFSKTDLDANSVLGLLHRVVSSAGVDLSEVPVSPF